VKIEYHRKTVVALNLHAIFGSCSVLNVFNLFDSVQMDFR
jgi:hypothetical protein